MYTIRNEKLKSVALLSERNVKRILGFLYISVGKETISEILCLTQKILAAMCLVPSLGF